VGQAQEGTARSCSIGSWRSTTPGRWKRPRRWSSTGSTRSRRWPRARRQLSLRARPT